MAILDYKTSTTAGPDHGMQLKVYADAGHREGLDVRGAYVHDLEHGGRASIDVGDTAVGAAESAITEAAARLRSRDFAAQPGLRCGRCEVRAMCSARR